MHRACAARESVLSGLARSLGSFFALGALRSASILLLLSANFLMSQFLRSLFTVVLLASLLCVPWLERPFHTRGEPREALVSQAMLSTNNWISPPAYNGTVPSKPPFSHWLAAAVSLPGGEVTEATARLPSAVAFLAFIAGFFVFVAKRVSVATAVGSALVLMSSSEWFRAVSTCRVDMILAVSMAGALLALYSWWERGCRGIPLPAIVLTACATLTKGPVGFVLPLGIFSLFAWLKRDLNIMALVLIAVRAVAIALPVVGIASIWYLLGYLERGDAFVDKIMYENFARFTSSMADEPHKHTVFYLIGMLLIGLLPWTVCGACASGRSHVTALTKVSQWRSMWRRLPDLYQFSLVSVVVIVLFFSIPSSKRSVYLLPAFPFFALLIELVLRGVEQSHQKMLRALERVVIGGTTALLAVAGLMVVVPLVGVSLEPAAFMRSLTTLKIASVVVVFALLAGPLRGSVQQIMRKPLERLSLAMIASVAIVSFFIYDTIAWQLSPRNWLFSEQFTRSLPQPQPERWYAFGSDMYGASFYLKKPFTTVDSGTIPAGSLVMLESKRLDQFRSVMDPQAKEIFRYHSGLEDTRKDIVVVQVQAPLGVQP
jgi:4-amino-4-deoxy-L-arabinose transferase-like glycosyltransferase